MCTASYSVSIFENTVLLSIGTYSNFEIIIIIFTKGEYRFRDQQSCFSIEKVLFFCALKILVYLQ